MGRKIPGRKHRGVKDPEKQRLESYNRIKDKINAPPANPDEQHVPKSFERIAALITKARNGDFSKKKPKKKPQTQKRFVQLPFESDRKFLLRINKACAVAKHEAAFENKFGVEIKRGEAGEVIDVAKRPKDIVQVMLKEEKNKKKKKKKSKGGEEKEILTKSQKRRVKLVEKKKKKLEKADNEWDKFQDKVQFGEQVHAPPSLTLPKRNIETSSKLGTKKLLLTNIFKKNEEKIDLTVKRKKLPIAVRRQINKDRDEAMKIYRLSKKKT